MFPLPRRRVFNWFPCPPKIRRQIVAGVGSLLLLTTQLSAFSLQRLEADPTLTPQSFSHLFENFKYELFAEVQPVETFLRSETGDCDDYACTADLVLSAKGYETRLVQVRLAGMVSHAVCYIIDQKVYLDFNNRAVFFTLTRCAPELRQIAQKVAKSLRANWTTAYEFSYSYEEDRKRITSIVVRTDPPANDPPPLGTNPTDQKDRFWVE